jgi:hypothetical protein
VRAQRSPAHRASYSSWRLAVGEQLLERRLRDAKHRHVAGSEMGKHAVEAIGDRRACRAAGFPLGPEHEVVDDELRAAVEEFRQGLAPDRASSTSVRPIPRLAPVTSTVLFAAVIFSPFGRVSSAMESLRYTRDPTRGANLTVAVLYANRTLSVDGGQAAVH